MMVTAVRLATFNNLLCGLRALFLSAPFFALILQVSHAQVAETQIEFENYEDVQQGSLMLQSTSWQGYRNSPLMNTDVKIQVTGLSARVSVSQQFTNPNDSWVNGIYVFPLPENAAVDRLSMQVGQRIMVGEIQPKERAKATYERAKAEGKKASLVSQQRPNIFSNSVANIGPHETVVVNIEYQQKITFKDNQFSLRFPMTVAPRYMPGKVISNQGSATGWALNTDQVPDAAEISPKIKHPDSATNLVSISVVLNAGLPLADIVSEHHAIAINQPDKQTHQYQLSLTQQAIANRDFVLRWSPKVNAQPQAALFSQRWQDEDYALLMLMPPQGEQNVPFTRNVTFVLDTSGSMAGGSIQQAKKALIYAIDDLQPQDSFNLIEFNSNAYALWALSRPADQYSKQQAIDFIKKLNTEGGTEMAKALMLALVPEATAQNLQQVIFITDGSVGNEAALMQQIRTHLGDKRLFTVGIGSAPNSYFMSEAAQNGKGSFTYIGSTAEVQSKMQSLLEKLKRPTLTDININLPGGMEMYPSPLPDLYAGEPVIASIKGALPEMMKVSGRQGDLPWALDLTLVPSEQSGLNVLWARDKIQHLTREQRKAYEKSGFAKQIEDIAMQHHLVSKYTSLVAVDKTPSRPNDQSSQDKSVPVHLPADAQAQQIFGRLPQTATSMPLHLLIGGLALLLTLCLYLWPKRQLA